MGLVKTAKQSLVRKNGYNPPRHFRCAGALLPRHPCPGLGGGKHQGDGWGHGAGAAVGKIENIDRDIAHVCAKTKMSLAFFRKFSLHSVSASSKLGQFYTPRIREKVLEKYAKDFEFFGYDPKI